MTNRVRETTYVFRVVEEDDGLYLSLRNLSTSRIVLDARPNYIGTTLTVVIDVQSGEMTLRSLT